MLVLKKCEKSWTMLSKSESFAVAVRTNFVFHSFRAMLKPESGWLDSELLELPLSACSSRSGWDAFLVKFVTNVDLWIWGWDRLIWMLTPLNPLNEPPQWGHWACETAGEESEGVPINEPSIRCILDVLELLILSEIFEVLGLVVNEEQGSLWLLATWIVTPRAVNFYGISDMVR